jgi:hypothetical protein
MKDLELAAGSPIHSMRQHSDSSSHLIMILKQENRDLLDRIQSLEKECHHLNKVQDDL